MKKFHQSPTPFLLLILLTLVVFWVAPSQATPTEAQSQIQAPSALTNPSTPACIPPCHSAEQEVALVEVRKILQEARKVAQEITIQHKFFQREMVFKSLQAQKAMLINKIEEAQFRAGDFSTSATTAQPWYLAFAQVKYGKVQEAVQTAARIQLDEDSLLALVKTLASTGQMQAAISVAQTNIPKVQLEHWRYRNEAVVLALIAREQKRIGDQAASETIRLALKAALAVKYPPDRVLAFIHVARAQAAMGDQSGSADSFRQAIQAAIAIRRDGTPTGALAGIAVAQAESGNQAGSAQTFQESIRLTNDPDAKANAFRLVRTACLQVVRGQRATGLQTFQQAVQVAESLPPIEVGRVLREVGDWQLKAGEREAFVETFNRARENAKVHPDEDNKSDVLSSMAMLAARAGYMNLALDFLEVPRDVRRRIGFMRFLAELLITAHERDGIQPVSLIKRFAQEAPALAQQATFRDKQDEKFVTKDIAVIQAAAGDLPAALRTIETISDESYLAGYVYPEVIQLLTKQGELVAARQVVAGLKEDWLLSSVDAIRELAKLGVRFGDVQGTLAWARQRPSAYARVNALLGMTEALMEQHRIEDISKSLSQTPLRGQGISPCN